MRHMLVGGGRESNFNAALHESGRRDSHRTEDGHTLAHFNPYFQVDARAAFTTLRRLTSRGDLSTSVT